MIIIKNWNRRQHQHVMLFLKIFISIVIVCYYYLVELINTS